MSRVANFERQVWLLDQKINQRGFKVDTALARAAARACKREKKVLDAQVSDITMGCITSGTQRAKLKDFLRAYGVNLADMKAGTLETAANDSELAAEARVLIEARQSVSKASTAKYERILAAVGPDGRLRGALQYAGAKRTSRWAGRIFQPHNMPRPKRELEAIELGIAALKLGIEDLIDNNAHELCSDALRSLIIAAAGNELAVADYSSIEGRVLAWLANEKWKLDAYHGGVDMYIQTYQKVFGLADDYDVSKPERQQGKVFELSMGYEGGVKALVGAAASYGVDLKKLGTGAWKAAPSDVRSRAKWLYDFAVENNNTCGLSRKLHIQLEAAKLMWRRTAPRTVAMWKHYRKATIKAIKHPGTKYKAGKCIFCVRSGYLTVRLPSGRLLLYAKPKVSEDGDITYLTDYGGRQFLYGGKLAENITQAVARDVLALALLRVDKAGFWIVMHIHDEIIAEVKKGARRTVERMIAIMEKPVPWAPGLPVKAEGYQAFRFKKE